VYARDVLAKISLFAGLPSAKLDELAAKCIRKKFGAKETVVFEGDTGYSMYVILAGRVVVSRLNETGSRVYFHELGPTEFFGELSLLSGVPRSADVTTLQSSEFLIIDRDSFVNTVLGSQEVTLNVLSHLCSRLRDADEARITKRPVRQRLILALLEQAEANAHLQQGARDPYVVKSSRQQLADRIFARRETVSRELTQLAADKYVRIVGKQIVLCKPDKLRALCD